MKVHAFHRIAVAVLFPVLLAGYATRKCTRRPACAQRASNVRAWYAPRQRTCRERARGVVASPLDDTILLDLDVRQQPPDMPAVRRRRREAAPTPTTIDAWNRGFPSFSCVFVREMGATQHGIALACLGSLRAGLLCTYVPMPMSWPMLCAGFWPRRPEALRLLAGKKNISRTSKRSFTLGLSPPATLADGDARARRSARRAGWIGFLGYHVPARPRAGRD